MFSPSILLQPITVNMSEALKIVDLQVKFEDFLAVKGICLSVDRGEVRGLLGGNGAGKSTTLRVAGGVIRPTSGQVFVGNHEITRSYQDANAGRDILGYCPDVGGLVSGATPLDHVRLVASLRRDKSLFDKGSEAIKQFGLEDFKNSPISGFSHGMMRRLSVLLAYVTAKELLILDEPFDGVDPLGVEIINDIVSQAQQEGKGIIISTHLQELLVNVSDTISIMAKGRILATDTSDNLKNESSYKTLLLNAE